MADSWNKKEREKKKQQNKKDKEEKKQQRKEKAKDGGLDGMIAFVDENGVITSTPPDPSRKTVVNAEDIDLGVSGNKRDNEASFARTGVVTLFNDSKGYGFIRDAENGQSIFVHVTNLEDKVQERDRVSFDIGRGPKGTIAINVKLVR